MSETHHASVASASPDDAPGWPGPTDVELRITDIESATWTGELVNPLPAESAGPGEVVLRLASGQQAPASYDPTSTPQFHGQAPFGPPAGA